MLILTNYIRRWFWKLTDQELISGIFFKKRYSLKGITKIVEGLPATSKYQKLDLFCEPAAQSAAIYRSASLFIKFDDRSFLPLNLHGLVNGDQLIAELEAKLNHVLDKSYEYTS